MPLEIKKTSTITLLKCPKCGHEWEPRHPTGKPKSCPECKGRLGQYWEQEASEKEEGK